MAFEASGNFRFGDVLALARRSWIRRMADELERMGYLGYRAADAVSLRVLHQRPLSIGDLGRSLRVTRQAARKVARQLEQRGYVNTASDPDDGRKVVVALTDEGKSYARAIGEVISALNQALAERVSRDQLIAADIVLRAVIAEDEELSAIVQRIATPVRIQGHT